MIENTGNTRSQLFLLLLVLFAVFILLSLSCAAYAEDVDLSKYKYYRQITPDCSEFIGYSRFEITSDIYSRSNNLGSFYINSEYFVEQGSEDKTDNWYVQDSNVQDIDALKQVLDGSSSTYYSLSKPDNFIELKLKNPNQVSFDKVIIDLEDSEATNIEFFDSGSDEIAAYMSKSDFTNTFTFNRKIVSDEITIKLYFDNIIKLSEISLLNRNSNDYAYFFVNNDCKRTFDLYYGGYGTSSFAYNRRDMSKIMSSSVSGEKPNPAYDADIDSDGVINEDDNCVKVKNPDQKDVNYNGVGDSCEDFDSDSIINLDDNCIDDYNYDQKDSDNDGKGDVCDDSDDRFSEQNSWIIYAVVVFVLIIFGLISYKLFSKND